MSLEADQARRVVHARLRQAVGQDHREPAVVVAERQLGVAQVHLADVAQPRQVLLGREDLADDALGHGQHVPGVAVAQVGIGQAGGVHRLAGGQLPLAVREDHEGEPGQVRLTSSMNRSHGRVRRRSTICGSRVENAPVAFCGGKNDSG